MGEGKGEQHVATSIHKLTKPTMTPYQKSAAVVMEILNAVEP